MPWSGQGATVDMPIGTKKFDWEIELAAVIGKTARYVTAEHALDHIAGYTVRIDFSARDHNRAPEPFYKLDWVAGKANDTCCPMGPWIVPAERHSAIRRTSRSKLSVNGEVKQDGSTSRDDLLDRRADRACLGHHDARSGRRGADRHAGRRRRAEGHVPQSGDRVDAEIDGIGKLVGHDQAADRVNAATTGEIAT